MSTEISKKHHPLKWFWNYLREARAELMKVTWPSREDIVKYSLTVIVISVLLAVFMGGLDFILNIGVEKLISLTS